MQIPLGTSQLSTVPNIPSIYQVKYSPRHHGIAWAKLRFVSKFNISVNYMLINSLPSAGEALVCGLLTVDPTKRMTLADVYQHPWCLRWVIWMEYNSLEPYYWPSKSNSPSQLAQQGVQVLADKLTESLRMTGDLGYATPAALDNACVSLVSSNVPCLKLAPVKWKWIKMRTRSCSPQLTNHSSRNPCFSS